MLKYFLTSLLVMPVLAQACCRAMTADCLACSEGISVERFCSNILSRPGFSNVAGCPPPSTDKSLEMAAPESHPPARACCRARTAECMACTEGITVEEWCARPFLGSKYGCPVEVADEVVDRTLEHVCPQVKCPNNCRHGYRTDRDGCDTCSCHTEPQRTLPPSPEAHMAPRPCCMAMNAVCMACSEQITVAELCARPSFASIAGCEAVQEPAEPAEPACPLVRCRMFCEHGFVQDDKGCDTCKCAPSPQLAGDAVQKLAAPQQLTQCCKAMTAQCMSCSYGMTLKSFCADTTLAAAVPGCPPPVTRADPPSQLTALALGPNAAMVSWDFDGDEAASFEIKYKRVGGTWWRRATTSSKSQRLRRLLADSEFKVRVVAISADGVRSLPAVSTFRTLPKSTIRP